MIKYIEAKSILSKLKGVDTLFGITYNMNLHRGVNTIVFIPIQEAAVMVYMIFLLSPLKKIR